MITSNSQVSKEIPAKTYSTMNLQALLDTEIETEHLHILHEWYDGAAPSPLVMDITAGPRPLPSQLSPFMDWEVIRLEAGGKYLRVILRAPVAPTTVREFLRRYVVGSVGVTLREYQVRGGPSTTLLGTFAAAQLREHALGARHVVNVAASSTPTVLLYVKPEA